MAKKSKVRTRREHREGTGTLRPKPLVVFCVEGQSEESYIKALRELRYNDEIAFQFLSEPGTSLKNLLNACRRAVKKPDFKDSSAYWIVCDVDRNRDHARELKRWLEGERNRIALSNPCLEYWLLLHFTSSPKCSSAKAALGKLRQHWPDYRKGLGSSDKFWERIVEKTEDAVRCETARQKSMGRKPSAWPDGPGSQMPMLVEWLDELLANESAKSRELHR